jgi:hypothetical protein
LIPLAAESAHNHSPPVPIQAKIPQLTRGKVHAWFFDSSIPEGAAGKFTFLILD